MGIRGIQLQPLSGDGGGRLIGGGCLIGDGGGRGGGCLGGGGRLIGVGGGLGGGLGGGGEGDDTPRTTHPLPSIFGKHTSTIASTFHAIRLAMILGVCGGLNGNINSSPCPNIAINSLFPCPVMR